MQPFQNQCRLNREVIERYLTTRNLTKRVLAARVGITPEYLSRLLAGKYGPGPVTRVNLGFLIKGSIIYPK